MASTVATTCAAYGPTMPAHHSPSLTMTAAHVVAAVLLGLALARGEAAVWFLAALVWPSLPSRVHPRLPVATAPLVTPCAGLPRRLLRSGGLGLRGPPAAQVAAAA